MKKSPVTITEPAAVAALAQIYFKNGPGNLEWDFSIPGQVTAKDGRLEARDWALTKLNLIRAGLKGSLDLARVKTLTAFTEYGNNNLRGTYLEDLPGLAEGVKWLRQAAEQGDSEARFILGQAYITGGGVKSDLAEAVKWFRLAAEQGHAEAQCGLGDVYRGCYPWGAVEENLAEAVKRCLLAAEQGQAEAQYNLALFYDFACEMGGHFEEDLPEAARWYRLADVQGHAEAQSSLGNAYAYGEGVGEDKALAVKWWRLAAVQGQAEAQVRLGQAYEHGEGVAQDQDEAAKWYRLAAKNSKRDT